MNSCFRNALTENYTTPIFNRLNRFDNKDSND